MFLTLLALDKLSSLDLSFLICRMGIIIPISKRFKIAHRT